MAAEPLTALLVDQPLNQIGDVLLPASGRVQLAAHLGETPIDVSAEVTEVLTQSIETRRRSVSEVANLSSDHRVKTTDGISAGAPLLSGLRTRS